LTTELVVEVVGFGSCARGLAGEWLRFSARAVLKMLSRDSRIVKVCDEGPQGLGNEDWGE
jgi:hypothetical protein